MSFTQKIGESFSKHPVPWIVGAVVVGAGAYFLIKKIGGKVVEQGQILKDELKLAAEGQKLSYPLTTYNGFADTIFKAGEGFGTDEAAIYGVFDKMKNDLDIVQLVKAFGSRRPEWTLIETGLAGYLASELNAEEISKINSILSRKGIKYRF